MAQQILMHICSIAKGKIVNFTVKQWQHLSTASKDTVTVYSINVWEGYRNSCPDPNVNGSLGCGKRHILKNKKVKQEDSHTARIFTKNEKKVKNKILNQPG